MDGPSKLGTYAQLWCDLGQSNTPERERAAKGPEREE